MTKIAALGSILAVGTRQVETATVTGTCTGSGDYRCILTATGMTGTPITTDVAILDEDTADAVATKVCTALNLVANITAWFKVEVSGPNIILTSILAAADDAAGAMNLDMNNQTSTGMDDVPTSANTTLGVAFVTTAQVENIGGPSLSLDQADVTTHDSTGGWEESVITLIRSGEISLDIIYDPNTATHAATSGLVYRIENKLISAIRITFPGPYLWYFDAYITGFTPNASASGAILATVSLKVTGQPVLV